MVKSGDAGGILQEQIYLLHAGISANSSYFF
jgi:hypothetical protein